MKACQELLKPKSIESPFTQKLGQNLNLRLAEQIHQIVQEMLRDKFITKAEFISLVELLDDIQISVCCSLTKSINYLFVFENSFLKFQV